MRRIVISSEKIVKELPSPKDSKEVPEGEKENLGPKWKFQKGKTVINNDTKQWVDEQDKFWKEEEKRKDRVKQKESVPRKFEPKTPVKILQRGKQSITAVPSQAHNRPKDDRYAQGQNYSWNKGYVKPEYWNGHRPRYMDLSMVMKIRIGDKEMVMERRMVLKIRKGQERSIQHQVPKAIPIIPTIETGNLLSLHHQGG